MKYLGIPYVWAGATPSGGFDCSGLVLYVYAKFGVAVPARGHDAGAHGRPGLAVAGPAGGPRLLRLPGLLPPRGHLHRQRPVHRGAAHRRRGQGQPAGRAAAARSSAGTPSDCPDAAAPPRSAALSPSGATRYTAVMPWYALLIVALASLAVVIGALVYVGLKGWRLAKHGAAVSRRIAPLADGLSRRADELAAAAERLSADGEQLAANLARLQRLDGAPAGGRADAVNDAHGARTTSSPAGSPARRSCSDLGICWSRSTGAGG